MFRHQLPRPFQIPLFQIFSLSDEGLCHRFHPDYISHPAVFRDVRTQGRVRNTHRVNLSTAWTAEEGEFNIASRSVSDIAEHLSHCICMVSSRISAHRDELSA